MKKKRRPHKTQPKKTGKKGTLKRKKFAKEFKKIEIEETIKVKDLAKKLKKSPSNLVKILYSLGVKTSVDAVIDFDTALITAHELGYEVIPVKKEQLASETITSVKIEPEIKPPEIKIIPKGEPRAPVVTVMGHIDHGKTTLLDTIRKTKVAASEYGGITQHIGAYKCKIGEKEIVFIDTPGHEAFTAMRARGAKITDIVLLIVDAVDSVMPQTIEAVNHARAANVPIVVAINKIDLPNANPRKVMRDLLERCNLVPEEWGGDVICQPISAKIGTNIDTLLELILSKAEKMDLRTEYNCPGEGTVIESKLDSKRGIVATVLLQKGRLSIGDRFIVGNIVGKIRAMFNDRGEMVKTAEPVTPVQILGFDSLPQIGEILSVVEDEKDIRLIVEQQREMKTFRERAFPTLDDLIKGEKKSLNLILKTDTQGTLEAINGLISRIPSDEIKINIINSSVGAIIKSDVDLALLTNAIIIGFNVTAVPEAAELARNNKVEIKIFRVIYDLFDDIKKMLTGLAPPKIIENIVGKAEIKQVFKISKVGNVAGCLVTSGKILLGLKARVIRDSAIVYDGSIASLRRFKTDVKEVQSGLECGVILENFQDIKSGDIIEVYTQEIIKQNI